MQPTKDLKAQLCALIRSTHDPRALRLIYEFAKTLTS